ncbi:hypothetical protein FGO68_gene12187 [Halteria grandinella]|uniref:Uncharacterized protein n=1 Tax=Halteria grandinella TaxID=5974 RepID=A0A8J8NQ11_HALGN|nr:hypothetical protein FGO68_gene12187 [Halteria grandinella]
MDRTWRDRVEKEGSALDDPTLTRWQKFIQGGYSLNNVGRKFAEGLALKQRKVEFLEDLIEKKEEFKEERDRLLIRMLEVKILNTFNMYRIPFMAGSFGFCLAFFLKSKMSLHVRLLPLMFLGSFASMYNYQVGQYGVYRNIDEIYKVLTDKRDSEVGGQAWRYLKDLASEQGQTLRQRLLLKRKRYAEQKGEAITQSDEELEAEIEKEIQTAAEQKVEKKPSKLNQMIRDGFKGKKNEALGFRKKKDESTESTQEEDDLVQESPDKPKLRLRDMTPEQREAYLKSKLKQKVMEKSAESLKKSSQKENESRETALANGEDVYVLQSMLKEKVFEKTAKKLEDKAEREEDKRGKIGTDEEVLEEKKKWKIVIQEQNDQPQEQSWISINLNFIGGAIGTLGMCAVILAILQ